LLIYRLKLCDEKKDRKITVQPKPKEITHPLL
jgi:hypothetical protein